MMYRVTGEFGLRKVEAESFSIDNGHLFFASKEGGMVSQVAAFAPGAWRDVTPEREERANG